MALKHIFNFSNKQEKPVVPKWFLQQQEKERLSLPNLKEAVDVIANKFTEEQLKQLSRTYNNEIITFSQQLLWRHANHKPRFTTQKMEEIIDEQISKYKNIFMFEETSAANLIFTQVFEDLFTKDS